MVEFFILLLGTQIQYIVHYCHSFLTRTKGNIRRLVTTSHAASNFSRWCTWRLYNFKPPSRIRLHPRCQMSDSLGRLRWTIAGLWRLIQIKMLQYLFDSARSFNAGYDLQLDTADASAARSADCCLMDKCKFCPDSIFPTVINPSTREELAQDKIV